MTSERAADFDTVFRDSYPAIVHAAWLIVGDPEVARECCQDAFVEALRRWKRIATYDSPGAWVRRVAINKALHHRARKRPPRRELRVIEAADATVVTQLDLRAALAQLTPNQRTAVVLHHACDLPLDAVADQLGCSVQSVKTHLSRGRAKLAEALGEPSDITDSGVRDDR